MHIPAKGIRQEIVLDNGVDAFNLGNGRIRSEASMREGCEAMLLTLRNTCPLGYVASISVLDWDFVAGSATSRLAGR